MHTLVLTKSGDFVLSRGKVSDCDGHANYSDGLNQKLMQSAVGTFEALALCIHQISYIRSL